MGKEIERKFTVTDLSVVTGRVGSRIVQGYIADHPMTVRVRIIEAEAFMTLKCRTVGIERDGRRIEVSGAQRDIAARFGVSASTVESDLRQAYRLLDDIRRRLDEE
jgi:CYTH domain-containing protein